MPIVLPRREEREARLWEEEPDYRSRGPPSTARVLLVEVACCLAREQVPQPNRALRDGVYERSSQFW